MVLQNPFSLTLDPTIENNKFKHLQKEKQSLKGLYLNYLVSKAKTSFLWAIRVSSKRSRRLCTRVIERSAILFLGERKYGWPKKLDPKSQNQKVKKEEQDGNEENTKAKKLKKAHQT